MFMSLPQTIDVHTHILPPGWEDLGARFKIAGWPGLKMHSSCDATIMLGDRVYRKITDQCFAPGRRISDMDREGIGRQLISPVPVLLCYWGSAEATAEFARIQNDNIAALVDAHPERFLGAGTVALQSARLALPELERMKTLGFPAIEIGTHVNGRDLDDPEIFETLAACEALDLAVFVHPQGPSIGQERMKEFYLPFMVGYPADTSLAIARLILGGVLERLPRLRIGFAHGGGGFLAIAGRLDHGYASKAEARKLISKPPAHYAQRLFFDCLTHDRRTLAHLCAVYGSDKVMLGSDYPFDMGVEHPLAQLEGVGLSPGDLDNIRLHAAEGFLGLA
jgi:aminocarboxymuconate-semialdehyde decarboxylase